MFPNFPFQKRKYFEVIDTGDHRTHSGFDAEIAKSFRKMIFSITELMDHYS